MASYLRPARVDEALAALAAGPRALVAGGTDYYPARVGRPLRDEVIDLSALDELAAIDEQADGYRIGALVTWSDILRAPLPAAFDGLKAAAREIGGPQVQNVATLCGNLCNASPAADGIPNLLALDARVELRSVGATRRLPIAEFVRGNRDTARRADELVTAVQVPRAAPNTRSIFLKLGARRYLVISIVMVAAVLATDEHGRIATARLAVGSCAPSARRLPVLEAALVGQPLAPELAERVNVAQLAPLAPIDDPRGSAEYRIEAALTLLRRALVELAEGVA